MVVWVDAQVSPALAAWLRRTLGLDAYAVRDLGLREAEDPAIFAAAGALVSLSVVHCLYRWRYLRPRARALHASLPRVHSGSSGPTHVAGPVSLSSRRGDS